MLHWGGEDEVFSAADVDSLWPLRANNAYDSRESIINTFYNEYIVLCV